MKITVPSFIASVMSLNLSEAFAQTSTAPAASSNPLGAFLPMILVFVVFYFLMIRPQAKQKKEHQKLLADLKKGDEVITSSGIHGKVFFVVDSTVTLEVADNVKFKIEKQHIATIKTPPQVVSK